jgi:hypothetical protein
MIKLIKIWRVLRLLDRECVGADSMNIQSHLSGKKYYFYKPHIAYLVSNKRSTLKYRLCKFLGAIKDEDLIYVDKEILKLQNSSSESCGITKNLRLIENAQGEEYIEISPKNENLIRISTKGENFISFFSLIEAILGKYKLIWTLIIFPFVGGIILSPYIEKSILNLVKKLFSLFLR